MNRPVLLSWLTNFLTRPRTLGERIPDCVHSACMFVHVHASQRASQSGKELNRKVKRELKLKSSEFLSLLLSLSPNFDGFMPEFSLWIDSAFSVRLPHVLVLEEKKNASLNSSEMLHKDTGTMKTLTNI